MEINDILYSGSYIGDRLLGDNDKVYLHATDISHCITKTCRIYELVKNGIKENIDIYSKNRMELGKAIHYYYQHVIYPELMISNKSHDFGRYPNMKSEEVIEVNLKLNIDNKLYISGTIDQLLEDNEGNLFIQDIKTTNSRSFNYISGAKTNHVIQLHVYMLLWNLNNPNLPIYTSRILYVNSSKPLETKVFRVDYNHDIIKHIYNQIDKFKEFIYDNKLPEPSYDYLDTWECNPKYCPFSDNCEFGM